MPNAAYEAHPWVIARIAPDFTLLDAWALAVEGDRDEFAAFVETIVAFDPTDARVSLSRALFWFRRRLGAFLRWDETKHRPIPGSSETTLSARLPDDLRGSMNAPPLSGGVRRPRSGFTPLYRTHDECAAEISNDTVHGVLHFGWVQHADGLYRAQMAVYAKPRGALGAVYVKLIQPFRHLIVYPSLVREIARAWDARSASFLD